MTQQVQAVRRRLVRQQVQTLRRGRWSALDPDVVADCVVAAGGDAVVAHRLMTRWEQIQGPRTVDMTPDEEAQLVAYVSERMASGFECDCGACGPVPHGGRIVHGLKP